MKKLVLSIIIFIAFALPGTAQFSIQMQGGLFRNKMDGGFQGLGASGLYKSNLSAGVAIDYSKGRFFGWMLGYNKFHKSILFNIDPINGNDQLGYTFVAHEINTGMLLRLGKHINLSIGSYIHINTNQASGDNQDLESKVYPISPGDFYKKIETGYQGKIQFQYFLTERIYAAAFMSAGMSWTDLRTENWNDAWSNLNGNREALSSGPMKNLYQHFGLCIGFRTKPKDD